MTRWERFDRWLFFRHGMSPLGLLVRILLIVVAIYILIWTFGTQDEVYKLK